MSNPDPKKASPSPGAGPRPVWVPTTQRKPAAPEAAAVPKPKRRGGVLLAAFGLVLLVVVVVVLVSRRGPPPADPMTPYFHAKALFEGGRQLEAMSAVAAAETTATEPRVRGLLAELKTEIELSPKLKTVSRLIDAKSFDVAEQQLNELLRDHPQNGQAQILRTSLKAARDAAQKPSTATAAPQPAAPVAAAAMSPTVPVRGHAPPTRRAGGTRLGVRNTRGRAADDRPASHESTGEPAPAKPEAPAPQAPVPQAQGTLTVNASEPSKVLVDGTDTGQRTPALLTLKVGVHRIEVISLRDGIARREQSVMVPAGGNVSVSINLRAKLVRPIDSDNPYGGK